MLAQTWSSQQLAFKLATSLAASQRGVPLTPLLVYVQRLARLLDRREKVESRLRALGLKSGKWLRHGPARNSWQRRLILHNLDEMPNFEANLLLDYIHAEFRDGRDRDVLGHAYELRSLVVMLDGISLPTSAPWARGALRGAGEVGRATVSVLCG